MCTYSTSSQEELVAHVCKIHRYHPNFRVYCATCLRSYSKWVSFKKHLSRGCSLQVNQELSRSSSSEDTQEATASHDLSGNISPEDDIHVVDNSLSTPSQEWQEAAFILYIKEKHVITQAAIDTILPHANQLFSSLMARISKELRTKLPREAMEVVEQAHSNVLPLFSNLSTRYRQLKYFREHFPLVVSCATT